MQNSNYQVLVTTDYAIFTFMKGNRNVNPFNLKRITESMKVRCLFSPILVNDNMEIVDGQHRFLAQKELKLPVYYINVGDYSTEEVHILNSNSSNWRRIDYLQGYIDMGLRPYIMLKEFMDLYPALGLKNALLIATLKLKNQEKTKSKYFESGNLKTFDIQYAKKVADMVYDYKTFYDGFNRNSFVLALSNIFANKNYDHQKMLSKLSRMKGQITDQTNYKIYIDQLEEVFNFSSKNKVSLKY